MGLPPKLAKGVRGCGEDLRSLRGVSFVATFRICLIATQDEQVYLSDPKALYHVVIKDADAYEETEYFTKCVYPLTDTIPILILVQN